MENGEIGIITNFSGPANLVGESIASGLVALPNVADDATADTCDEKEYIGIIPNCSGLELEEWIFNTSGGATGEVSVVLAAEIADALFVDEKEETGMVPNFSGLLLVPSSLLLLTL